MRDLVMAHLSLKDGFDMLDMEIVLGNLTEQDVIDALGSIDLVEEWKNVAYS